MTSPYALPLTQPVKAIARWAYAPVKDFARGVKNGLDEKSGKPVYLRVFSALRGSGHGFYPDEHTKAITWVGVILGAAAAITGAGLAAHALGFGLIGVTAACIGATSFGMMAGPFVVAGLVAAAGAVAGTAISAVPSFFEGLYLAAKQHKSYKAQVAATKAVPQLKTAAQNLKEDAGAMLKKISAMPAAAQVPLLRALNEQYRGTKPLSDSNSIVKAIDALPAQDRQQLVTSLQVTLKQAFEAAARQESDAAMALYTPVKTTGPLKIIQPRG
jgi:hypothetical protein